MEHLREELDALNSRLLEMSSLVEDSIARSVNAVVNRDKEEALTVFHNEAQINKLEIQIDNIAIRLLALQQPVAVDLRFVTMSIKINNNLERLADHATNIAEDVLFFVQGVDVRHHSEMIQNV